MAYITASKFMFYKKTSLFLTLCLVIVVLALSHWDYFKTAVKLMPKDGKKVVPNVKKVVKPEKVEDAKSNGAEQFRSMNLTTLYAYYLKLITKPDITCHKIHRYGNKDDGGWEICEDSKFAFKSPCLVYSFGINWDFTFDDAISKEKGCEVHSFDPSMKTDSFNRSSLVHFHNYGLKGYFVRTINSEFNQAMYELKNFEEILKSLGHEKTTIDFLKIDVEGPELLSLDLMLDKNLLQRVRQFAFEIHVFEREFSKDKFVSTILTLERLRRAGFSLYYSHSNPMGMFDNKGFGRRMTCCHEIFFVNTNF